MSKAPAVIYLEADDEVTSVVRRLRASEPGPVVIVAPGRSRATSSVVALRLLARAAEADGRDLRVVGDALTRSLAAEAGVAAFATLDDARRADAIAPGSQPRRAEIHVVRGPATEDGAPTLGALPLPNPDAPDSALGVPSVSPADEVTRPVPVIRPTARGGSVVRARPAPFAPAGWWRRTPVAAMAGIAVLLLGSLVAAAALLPAATITIVPRGEPIDPVSSVVLVEDPERIAGTAEATATVTATGSYEVNQAAAGSVVFFNFNFFDVEVPAGSLVATGTEEGDQAYATDAAVVVPAGEFDPFFGGITAGEAPATVTASATGEAGNVAAGAIDTVLDEQLAGQLRGFPSITEPLVTNPEPTAGGLAATGVEITQEDVDAAVEALRAALRQAVDEALADSEDDPHADPAAPAEAEITGLDDLVGTRDTETVQIRGTLAYERLVADATQVESEAAGRFVADPTGLPPGWQLLEQSTVVEIGEARSTDAGLAVDVTVTGVAVPIVEATDVVERVSGLSAEDAEAALEELGTASVELWPGWVSSVPPMDWRVEVRIVEPEALEP